MLRTYGVHWRDACRSGVSLSIERAPNCNSPPAVLLRESRREGKKVIKRTLANLSALSEDVIEGLKVLLRGGACSPRPGSTRSCVRRGSTG